LCEFLTINSDTVCAHRVQIFRSLQLTSGFGYSLSGGGCTKEGMGKHTSQGLLNASKPAFEVSDCIIVRALLYGMLRRPLIFSAWKCEFLFEGGSYGAIML